MTQAERTILPLSDDEDFAGQWPRLTPNTLTPPPPYDPRQSSRRPPISSRAQKPLPALPDPEQRLKMRLHTSMFIPADVVLPGMQATRSVPLSNDRKIFQEEQLARSAGFMDATTTLPVTARNIRTTTSPTLSSSTPSWMATSAASLLPGPVRTDLEASRKRAKYGDISRGRICCCCCKSKHSKIWTCLIALLFLSILAALIAIFFPRIPAVVYGGAALGTAPDDVVIQPLPNESLIQVHMKWLVTMFVDNQNYFAIPVQRIYVQAALDAVPNVTVGTIDQGPLSIPSRANSTLSLPFIVDYKAGREDAVLTYLFITCALPGSQMNKLQLRLSMEVTLGSIAWIGIPPIQMTQVESVDCPKLSLLNGAV